MSDGYGGAWDSCHPVRPTFTNLNGRDQRSDDDYLQVKTALDCIQGESKKERGKMYPSSRRLFYLTKAEVALINLMEERA